MSDPIDFLLARVADDEYDARRAVPLLGASLATDGERRLLISPARVLAECEAKRRIVEIHQLANSDQGEGVGCMHCDWDREWGLSATGGCDTLSCLALPYVDHPDYREEWRS